MSQLLRVDERSEDTFRRHKEDLLQTESQTGLLFCCAHAADHDKCNSQRQPNRAAALHGRVTDRLGGIGSRPRLDSGQLGIVAVQIANVAQAAKLVSLNAARQLSRFDGWREWSAPEFEVASNGPVATGIDGEAVVLEPPLRFTIAPGALTVLLPPSVTGLSPAALRPGFTGSTLRDLWRLAAGRQDPTRLE